MYVRPGIINRQPTGTPPATTPPDDGGGGGSGDPAALFEVRERFQIPHRQIRREDPHAVAAAQLDAGKRGPLPLRDYAGVLVDADRPTRCGPLRPQHVPVP